jgi:uroporphyrin-III C-methyltransferase
MVESILAPVREGYHVFAAFYGHPGVFVYSSHEAVRRALREGYLAEMTAAISAEDCLFADLGVDPGIPGCQSFEATDFLICDRKFDPRSSLVLWQIGVIGLLTWWEQDYDCRPGLQVLTERLLQTYPADHVVIVYEAAHLPTGEPRRDPVALKNLGSAAVTPISTLYIPPREVAEIDHNMLARLGIPEDAIQRIERKVLVPRLER